MSLFQGTPQQATSYVTSSSETPRWMQDAIYNQIQWSTNTANKPLEQFKKPLVAGFDPLQERAQEQVQTNLGAWRPDMDTATGGMTGMTGARAVDNVPAYMNPYLTNVTDRIAQLGARNLNEVLLPGVSDSFIRAGQFGSSRMGEFGARALRDTQESILGQQAGALQQGYTQALGASQADLGRQQQALGALGQMAQQEQALRSGDVAALEATGATRQQLAQRQTDADLRQFLEAREYPKTQLDWLSTQVRGMAPITDKIQNQSTQTTGQTYSPSPLSQMASLLAGAAGLSKLGS
jgi:hypothetical protein